jgi:hypothetical protein
VDPVERSINIRKSIDRASIFWKDAATDAIHDTVETPIRVFH